MPPSLQVAHLRFLNRGEGKADCPPPPRRRRFTAAQKARQRQTVAHVGRVVRKMAQTIESI
jgi:hypothetical protein